MSFLRPEVADAMAWPLLQATIGDVRKLGLKKLPYGPNVQIRKHGRIPLLDIGTVARIKKSGDEVLPGLYFCGFHVSPTGMLREIAIEAKRIARSVASV